VRKSLSVTNVAEGVVASYDQKSIIHEMTGIVISCSLQN